MARELDRTALIERSVTKKYRKEIWNPFIKAIKNYELINAGDKIAVCISGGKDSMLMAVLFSLLQKHSEIPFYLEYIVMNPGYNPVNLEKIKSNAEILKIPIHIFESDVFSVAEALDSSPCYLCARMRRGHLYNEAKKLGCNKIALGHHFDDVIETTLLGMFYGSQLQGMMPKLHSTNFEGMELIRPLYCIHEEYIISWARYNDLEFIRCACSVSEKNESMENGSKRKEIKDLIKNLKKINPEADRNIFNSIHAVCLDTFPNYKSGGKEHSFLERY